MAIRVGRFAIVDDDVREHGPWLVEQIRDGDPRVVQLIVLVEPVDARSAEFCEDVAGAVADLFVSEELSLTGGLIRAIRRAARGTSPSGTAARCASTASPSA